MQKYCFSTVIKSDELIHVNIDQWIENNNSCKAVTIALSPEHMPKHVGFEQDLFRYCGVREILFKLWREHENTNTHYHGVVLYPDAKTMKNLQLWINKKYGKILHANIYDPVGWIEYCTKIETPSPKDLNIIASNLSSSGDGSTGKYYEMFRLKYMFERKPTDYVMTLREYERWYEWDMERQERAINDLIEDDESIYLPVELTD